MLLRGLYAITDDILTPTPTILSQVEEALRGGIDLLQYRNKINTDEEIEGVAAELLALWPKLQRPPHPR
jgi:thiamine-phosphate pyrophosphorylase